MKEVLRSLAEVKVQKYYMQNVIEILKVKVLLFTLKSDENFNLSLRTFFNNMIVCFV